MLVRKTSLEIPFADVEAHTVEDGVGELVLKIEPKMIGYSISKTGAGPHAEIRKAYLIGINMPDVAAVRVA